MQTLGYYFFLSERLEGIVACITTSDKVMRLLTTPCLELLDTEFAIKPINVSANVVSEWEDQFDTKCTLRCSFHRLPFFEKRRLDYFLSNQLNLTG